MSQVIIYNQDNGNVAIIFPAPEALTKYGIKAIADKDVPAGKRYKIVDASSLPTDWSLQSTWVVDEADLTDGVGAESNEFPPETTPETTPEVKP